MLEQLARKTFVAYCFRPLVFAGPTKELHKAETYGKGVKHVTVETFSKWANELLNSETEKEAWSLTDESPRTFPAMYYIKMPDICRNTLLWKSKE